MRALLLALGLALSWPAHALVELVKQGERFTLTAPREVFYAETKPLGLSTFKTFQPGTYLCDGSTFGYVPPAGTTFSCQVVPTCLQVTPTCEPSSEQDRTKCGRELRGNTAAGEWSAFWWRDTANSRWCGYSWAGLYKFAPGPKATMAIVDSIKNSPGVAAIRQAIDAFTVKPAPGSYDEYEFGMLHYQACMAMQASLPASGVTFTGKCVQPVPPSPPVMASAWIATGGSIFTYSGGRLTSVTTRKATKGAPCDGVTKATIGATYQSLVNGSQSEVTACIKQ